MAARFVHLALVALEFTNLRLRASKAHAWHFAATGHPYPICHVYLQVSFFRSYAYSRPSMHAHQSVSTPICMPISICMHAHSPWVSFFFSLMPTHIYPPMFIGLCACPSGCHPCNGRIFYLSILSYRTRLSYLIMVLVLSPSLSMAVA